MSENLITPVERPGVLPSRWRLHERGMATVEYALGVIVVIVLIGVIVVAINTGSFDKLVNELIEAVMGWVQDAFDPKLLNPFKK